MTIPTPKDDPNQKVNVTFQIRKCLRKLVESIAKSLGHTRMKNGEEVAEIGGTLEKMVAFAAEHEKQFKDWLAKSQAK